jgi:23S rRNA pseudouridine1911/1915/1917 synthase
MSTKKYKIIEKTKDYLIVEKPAGMLVQRARDEDGLIEEVLKDFPEIEGVGDNERPGLVHRLDREVSGLLVIARTEEFFEHIKNQFQNREVKKIYLALVYGELSKDDDLLDFVLARSKNGRIAARPKGSEGREALTKIKVLERYKNFTFLEVQILTGRTHQIRAHLFAYNHPVCGDKLYVKKNPKSHYRCERMFLHSHILGFKNLKGEWVEYESKLPKELKECLGELKH